MIRLEITDPATGHVLLPHLSASLSFQMIRENPLFNQRGDYTYDIDISLRDPHNRAIYQHLDRITANKRPQNRRARLICDGHVIADGTEVILKKEGDTLKVQILAGNSEMNYLTADDSLRIREMNFGSIPSPTAAGAVGNAYKVYPQADYVFPQCVTSMPEEGSWTYINEIDWSMNTLAYREGTVLRPMPFVLYVFEKFIRLLGYTIGTNELLNDTRWTRLIMIHNFDTLDIAKMLPDWSAAEFLKQMEIFFNCVVCLNPVSKRADILAYNSFASRNNAIEIPQEDIVDDFERVYDAEEAGFLHHYEDIEYELPGGEYWKRTCLDPSVERLCTEVTATFAEVDQIPIEDSEWTIYHSTSPDLRYVRVNELCTATEEWARIYKRYIVNQFKPHTENSGSTTTLKVIPARTELHLAGISRIYPVAEEVEKKEEVEFKEAIGSTISETTVDNMQVCFYTTAGYSFGFNPGDRTLYALTFVRPSCATTLDYIDTRVGMFVHLPTYTGIANMTLELNGQQGLYNTHFRPEQAIDIQEACTIKFRARGGYDLKLPFLIRGRLFVCQQLKYTYADSHQHPIVEGTFYPYL